MPFLLSQMIEAYRWIGARQRLRTEFTVFVVEIPDEFRGVKDVVMEHGRPVVVRR